MDKSEVLGFVRQMKPRDHVIMFYSKPEDKREVLFTYLKAGLEQGEAAAYIAGQESPDRIRQAMKGFGIDVDTLQKSGALSVIDYRDWYIVEGKVFAPEIMERWKRLLDESLRRGFKGLRVAGETTCFFENRMVNELVAYEGALHRVLELPNLTAFCAYDSSVVAAEGSGDLYLDLIKAHSTVIFAGPESAAVKTYQG